MLKRGIGTGILWLGMVWVAACSIPGIRPEGRTSSISAHAPASRLDVYARAQQWYARNDYSVTRDAGSTEISGYRPIATDGNVETRAVVDFSITGSTAENTSYRVFSHTERGRAPLVQRVDQNAPEADAAVASLVAYLSCPTARWPRCP